MCHAYRHTNFINEAWGTEQLKLFLMTLILTHWEKKEFNISMMLVLQQQSFYKKERKNEVPLRVKFGFLVCEPGMLTITPRSYMTNGGLG